MLDYKNNRSLLDSIKAKITSSTKEENVVIIPKGTQRINCPNHTGPNGKRMPYSIELRERVAATNQVVQTDIECECGTIYRKEK